jgi:SAM-dependent methyltransferase
MNPKDKEVHIRRTMERYAKFGADPRTIGWPKNKTWLRYTVLTNVGDLQEKSILDLGCGYADMYQWLTDRGWRGEYTGYDIVPKHIEVAKKKYPHLEIMELDILETVPVRQFDYVFACGVMNAKVLEENNEEYVEKMLGCMFNLARIAVATDFLSPYVDFQGQWAYHPKMETILAIIRKLSKRFVVRHDYMPYEFSVYIFKNDTIDTGLAIFNEHMGKNVTDMIPDGNAQIAT